MDSVAFPHLRSYRPGSAWRKRPQDEYYSRQLGALEARFDFSGQRGGQSDCFTRFQLSLSSEEANDAFFARLPLAWAALRSMHPSLAFVVHDSADKHHLPLPREFRYTPPSSPETAYQQAIATLILASKADEEQVIASKVVKGPRAFLSQEHALSRLLVFKGPNLEHGLCICLSHTIADALSMFRLVGDLLTLVQDPSLPSPSNIPTYQTLDNFLSDANLVSPPPDASLLNTWRVAPTVDDPLVGLPLATEDLYPSIPLSIPPSSTSDVAPPPPTELASSNLARQRWFWAISRILLDRRYGSQPPSLLLPRQTPPDGPAGEPNTIWFKRTFSPYESAAFLRVSKESQVSPSLLLYGLLSIAMSNILSKIHPSAPYTPVIISFPISIRRFLDPAVSPIETDLALRINFGYLVFPNLPQSVDDVEKLKWSAVHGARLATRQFAKRFAPDATSRGQFHAHNHFHNMDRLHMRLGVEDYPIKEPKGAITCSMVGDLDRVLPTTFNVPTSSNTPSTIRLSDTMIGTRLHRGEGIFMEVFTWDQRITVCLGADDVCVEPALVQEILDQLETLAKCVATG